MQRPERPQVVIVGGGIAGLAAAWFLRQADVAVTVLEGAPRVGGKLAVSEIAGIAVDEGAEALLARRPEGVDLITAAGLGGQLVWPGSTAAALWTRGQFRPLPRRQFLGVPADLDELAAADILSAAGLARARQEPGLPATPRAGDVAVAGFVGARFGTEVVDRLVDPLLGGVYAGRSDQLSFEATMPALAEAAGSHASLGAAAAAVLGPSAGSPVPAALGRAAGPRAPVFTTLAGGLGTLPPWLAAASGAMVRTSAMTRELARTGSGWRLTLGAARSPETLLADAVILAVPARPASRLLGGVTGASAAAAALAGIDYASMAIVTLAYPAAAFPAPLRGSGYLVPAADGHPVKAVTFSTVKWPHLAGGQAGGDDAGSAGRPAAAGQWTGLHVVRCSLGRTGEEGVLQREDADLVALAVTDLAAATGVRGTPAASRVSRWGGALPQYAPGHLDRVSRIRAGVAAQRGLAVCGAALDGVGIPACVESARLAASQVLGYLQHRARAAAANRNNGMHDRA